MPAGSPRRLLEPGALQPRRQLHIAVRLVKQRHQVGEHGAECLELSNRFIPKLILLDIRMPDMDGFETCRRLRTNPALRHIPVAFLTALKSAADVTTGLAAGGNDFIVKPFDTGKLLERVKHWTGRSVDPAATSN